MVRVAAVIPAYNEEATIGAVIDAVRRVSCVDEVVVVSDGSHDETARVARRHGALVIELHANVGKGGALKAGIERADADVYVFLDADLIGLTPDHVLMLVEPVLQGRAAMTVGRFSGGRVATDLAQVVAPYLSGQRAVRREVLAGIPNLEVARFGVEMALTRHIQRLRIPVEEVLLVGLTHRTKEEKLGLLPGFLARMREYWDIIRSTVD
ncbi:MAG TPA: glycosyltransferase family 2 protein [Bacillota bacterium]